MMKVSKEEMVVMNPKDLRPSRWDYVYGLLSNIIVYFLSRTLKIF